MPSKPRHTGIFDLTRRAGEAGRAAITGARCATLRAATLRAA